MQRQSILVAALAIAWGAMPAAAQWRTSPGSPNGAPPAAPDTSQDDPRRDVGVARVSVADGDVQVLRGDTGDQMQARGGMPLAANDSVFTGRSSRAEVQLGPGNLVRLSEESRIRIVDLGNRYFRVDVLAGAVSVSQLRGGEADLDLTTPHTTVRPLKTGVYRLAVREQQTDLTVRKGEAEVASSRAGQKVKSGQRASVRGDRQSSELQIASADPKDSFDRWNERRDDLLEPNFRNQTVLLGGGFGGPFGGPFGLWDPFWGPGFYGGGFGPGVFIGGRVGGFGRGGFGGGFGGRRGGRR